MKYSSNYQSYILNFFGEFDNFTKNNEKNKLTFISYYSSLKNILPYKGKLKEQTVIFFIIYFRIFSSKKNS